MRDSVDVLLNLCRCLRMSSDEVGSLGELPKGADQWNAVIGLANVHYLTPALWSAVQVKGLEGHLPEDARDFLAEAHRLNAARNTRIRAQALELLAALAGADIRTSCSRGAFTSLKATRTP